MSTHPRAPHRGITSLVDTLDEIAAEANPEDNLINALDEIADLDERRFSVVDEPTFREKVKGLSPTKAGKATLYRDDDGKILAQKVDGKFMVAEGVDEMTFDSPADTRGLAGHRRAMIRQARKLAKDTGKAHYIYLDWAGEMTISDEVPATGSSTTIVHPNGRVIEDDSGVEESSMSRIFRHASEGSFAMVSADRSERSDAQNKVARRNLEGVIRQMGYGFIKVAGGYKETQADGTEVEVIEQSYFVPDIGYNDAKKLAHVARQKFGQESVLWGNEVKRVAESDGPEGVYLLYGSGSTERIGDTFTTTTAGPYFTRWRGHRFTFEGVAESSDAVEESEFDQAALKAVFLAGGSGSGKGFVGGLMFGSRPGAQKSKDGKAIKFISRVTRPYGFKVINSDEHLERLMTAAGLSVRTTKRDLANHMTQRNGIIVDGTGTNVSKLLRQKAELENLGYDTYMVFVHAPLEAALAGNASRERRVPEEIVIEKWHEAQEAKAKYQSLFGNNFKEIVRDRMYTEDEIVREVIPMFTRHAMTIVKKPIQNPVGREWLEDKIKNNPKLRKRVPGLREGNEMNTINEKSEKQKAYQNLFRAKMAEMGAKSPKKLGPKERKALFSSVSAAWKKHPANEDGEPLAYEHVMGILCGAYDLGETVCLPGSVIDVIDAEGFIEDDEVVIHNPATGESAGVAFVPESPQVVREAVVEFARRGVANTDAGDRLKAEIAGAASRLGIGSDQLKTWATQAKLGESTDESLGESRKTDLATSYYAAHYDAAHMHNGSVYYDPDDNTFDAAVGGFRGWDRVEVTRNVSFSDFGQGSEDLSKDEFVEMCIDVFGTREAERAADRSSRVSEAERAADRSSRVSDYIIRAGFPVNPINDLVSESRTSVTDNSPSRSTYNDVARAIAASCGENAPQIASAVLEGLSHTNPVLDASRFLSLATGKPHSVDPAYESARATGALALALATSGVDADVVQDAAIAIADVLEATDEKFDRVAFMRAATQANNLSDFANESLSDLATLVEDVNTLVPHFQQFETLRAAGYHNAAFGLATDVLEAAGMPGPTVAAIKRPLDVGPGSMDGPGKPKIVGEARDEFDYKWLGYGLVITHPKYGEAFLQGDEAADLYDELEAAPDAAAIQRLLDPYSDVMEASIKGGVIFALQPDGADMGHQVLVVDGDDAQHAKVVDVQDRGTKIEVEVVEGPETGRRIAFAWQGKKFMSGALWLGTTGTSSGGGSSQSAQGTSSVQEAKLAASGRSSASRASGRLAEKEIDREAVVKAGKEFAEKVHGDADMKIVNSMADKAIERGEDTEDAIGIITSMLKSESVPESSAGVSLRRTGIAPISTKGGPQGAKVESGDSVDAEEVAESLGCIAYKDQQVSTHRKYVWVMEDVDGRILGSVVKFRNSGDTENPFESHAADGRILGSFFTSDGGKRRAMREVATAAGLDLASVDLDEYKAMSKSDVMKRMRAARKPKSADQKRALKQRALKRRKNRAQIKRKSKIYRKKFGSKMQAAAKRRGTAEHYEIEVIQGPKDMLEEIELDLGEFVPEGVEFGFDNDGGLHVPTVYADALFEEDGEYVQEAEEEGASRVTVRFPKSYVNEVTRRAQGVIPADADVRQDGEQFEVSVTAEVAEELKRRLSDVAGVTMVDESPAAGVNEAGVQGWYVIYPDGGAWDAVHIKNGRVVQQVEQSTASTHVVARDSLAGVAQAAERGETKPVSADVQQAVLDAYGSGYELETATVERLVTGA